MFNFRLSAQTEASRKSGKTGFPSKVRLAAYAFLTGAKAADAGESEREKKP